MQERYHHHNPQFSQTLPRHIRLPPSPTTQSQTQLTFTMANIEQTWSLAGKVAVVTGSGTSQPPDRGALVMLTSI